MSSGHPKCKCLPGYIPDGVEPVWNQLTGVYMGGCKRCDKVSVSCPMWMSTGSPLSVILFVSLLTNLRNTLKVLTSCPKGKQTFKEPGFVWLWGVLHIHHVILIVFVTQSTLEQSHGTTISSITMELVLMWVALWEARRNRKRVLASAMLDFIKVICLFCFWFCFVLLRSFSSISLSNTLSLLLHSFKRLCDMSPMSKWTMVQSWL